MNFELLTTTTFIISTCLSHNTRIQRRIRQNPSQIRIAEIRKNRRPLGQKHEIIRPIPKAMTYGALQHRLPLILSPPLFFLLPYYTSASGLVTKSREAFILKDKEDYPSII